MFIEVSDDKLQASFHVNLDQVRKIKVLGTYKNVPFMKKAVIYYNNETVETVLIHERKLDVLGGQIVSAPAGYFIISADEEGLLSRMPVVAFRCFAVDDPIPIPVDGMTEDGYGLEMPTGEVNSFTRIFDNVAEYVASVKAKAEAAE